MARQTCSQCGGRGTVQDYCPACGMNYAYNSDGTVCYNCKGTGKVDKRCDTCGGSGYIDDGRSDSSSSSYSSSSSSGSTPSTPSRSAPPDQEAKMNNEADGYFMAKNYDKAISLYDKIIDKGGKFKFSAYFMRYKCYMIKGDYDQANSDLKRSADLGYKPALEELAKKGIQYTPKSSSDPLQEGNQFFNEGNYDKAIAKYSITIRKGENKSLALMKRAACYVKKGDKDQAKDDYTSAINGGGLSGSDLAAAKAELAKLK